MEGLAVTDLSHLSLADLSDISAGINSTFGLILKDTSRATEATELRMAETISKAWKASARVGMQGPLRKLLSGTATEKKIQAFVKSLGVKLSKPLSDKQIAILESRLRSIYKVAKKMAVQEVKAAKKKRPVKKASAELSVSFKLVDARAVQAINKQQIFWIGDFFNEHLSARIAGVARDVMIEQGLPQQEAGQVLRSALNQEFGITPGGKSQFAKDIPARYAGNPDLYFRQVASNAAHQSRTFGKMRAFEEADIVTYRLVNPDDERTGQICQLMSGQVFSVQVGVTHMEEMLDAENPEDIKKISPWLSAGKLKQTIGRSPKGSEDAAEKLERAGAILPPFHSLCRTEPVVIS